MVEPNRLTDVSESKIYFMKKRILLLFLLVISLKISAQTKLINHKRHSGNSASFSKAITKGLIGNSNFGNSPQRLVRNSRLDSVILLSATTAVMVTSESCHYEDYGGHDRSSEQMWSAGKDTIQGHELFNAEHSVQEIKKELKQRYYFDNNPESVVFIGFDGNYPVEEKKKYGRDPIPIVSKDEDTPPDEHWPARKRSWLDVLIISLFGTLFPTRF